MRHLLALAGGVALLIAPAARAQLVSNTNNWGVTFGVDGISSAFNPGGPDHPRGYAPYAYAARGNGLALNAGFVFLKHYMFGGDIGAVFFGGDRTFAPGDTIGGYSASTTNSLLGLGYVGLITSPLGSSPKLGRKWWLGARVGASKWSGERRVISCANCNVDPLAMKGGAFVEPFVVYGGGDRDGGGGIRLAYRHALYANSTIRDAVSLGLFFAFLRF